MTDDASNPSGTPDASNPRRCVARTRRGTGPQCARWAIAGGTVCPSHGGSTRRVKAAAAGRLVEQEALAAFGRLADVSIAVTDPLTALSQLAGHVKAWMEYVAGRIADLTSLSHDGFAGEQVAAEVELFERALDRCGTVFSSAARLRIDERLVAITEKQAEIVLGAIVAALDAAGVPAEQRADAQRAAARHLRAVR